MASIDARQIEELTGEKIPDGRESQAEALATYVLALIGVEAGRTFVSGDCSIVEKVNGGAVLLREPLDVTSVELLDGTPVSWSPLTVKGPSSQLLINDRRVSSATLVRVTGKAPGEQVSLLVATRVAQIVLRTLRINPTAASGVQQHSETSGPFTQQDTYATWAIGGDPVLSPDDIKFARSLARPRVGATWVMRP